MRRTLCRALWTAAIACSMAPAQTLFIRDATVHTLAGEPIENGSVLIQDGLIQGVGKGLRAPRGAAVIDAKGKHLYPGLFDAFTPIGLNEISAVGVTSDQEEKGDFNPQLEAVIGVNPESEHIAVIRSNGVTEALTAMSGGVIAGRASVIQLDGWTWEEMALEQSGPLVVEWPTIEVQEDKGFKKAQAAYGEKVAELARWIESARHYAQAKQADGGKLPPDPKLESLAKAATGREPLLVVASLERDIRNAVAFCAERNLKMVLVGGAEAWKAKDLLKEKGISVILGPLQTLPLEEDDPYDRIFSQPAELFEAGVPFAISSSAPSGPLAGAPYPKSRSLPYEAASAVPFGLPQDEALKAVTKYPAEILGMGDKLGTIEEGKIANLILTDGDPLEITTHVEHVIISGRDVSTDNKHLRLYEKYSQRPERQVRH